jgi:hypothetical protein
MSSSPRVIKDAQSVDVPATLYHYTNQRGLLGIIQEQRIWATHTQYLNDRREFALAIGTLRAEVDQRLREGGDNGFKAMLDAISGDRPTDQQVSCLREMKEYLSTDGLERVNVCVCSFSAVRDSLSQWRAYGGSCGFALGFSGKDIRAAIAPERHVLVRCVYEAALQRAIARDLIKELLEENLARVGDSEVNGPPCGNLAAYLNKIAPMFKHESFSSEAEWRLITRPMRSGSSDFGFREGQSSIVPYCKVPLWHKGRFPLVEVVIGPTIDPERSAAAVQTLFISHGLKGVTVTVSEVPYRQW